MSTAVALLNRESIIERIAQGDYLETVSQDLGVKAPSICKYLANDPDYQQAREIGTQLRLERTYRAIREAETDAPDADSASKLARAREAAFRATAWFAEREFPARWGQTNKVQVEHVGDLGERLRRARERVIEHESVVPQPQSAVQHDLDKQTVIDVVPQAIDNK